MPHPVDILLDKNCAINPAWAVFDPGWYLFKYPDVLACGITGDTALAYYLKTGAKRGHDHHLELGGTAHGAAHSTLRYSPSDAPRDLARDP